MSTKEFYDDFYSKALKSNAHSKLCKKVYGVDLCQHGMADNDQIMIMLEALKINDRSNVLDVGCGPGAITKYIQEQTKCYITGIDISEKAIEYAIANNKSKKETYLISNMVDYSCENDLYDAILFIDTHYFVNDFLSLIPKYQKALKRNGRIAIFSDQGTGIINFDESKTLPSETIIGKYLVDNEIEFEGICFYYENKKHWRYKQEVLLELKDEFIKEGNDSIFENRIKECNKEIENIGGRYLFIIEKRKRPTKASTL